MAWLDTFLLNYRGQKVQRRGFDLRRRKAKLQCEPLDGPGLAKELAWGGRVSRRLTATWVLCPGGCSLAKQSLDFLTGENPRTSRATRTTFSVVVAGLSEFTASGWMVLEHPEDLGKRQSGVPRSIWRWPELSALAAQGGLDTGALLQSGWGVPYAKPTRFMFTLPRLRDIVCPGWPCFAPDGGFLGPLSRKRGHGELIGKTGADFQTTAAAVWPDKLCEKLASLAWAAWRERASL